jgi:hypothetical protein
MRLKSPSACMGLLTLDCMLRRTGFTCRSYPTREIRG